MELVVLAVGSRLGADSQIGAFHCRRFLIPDVGATGATSARDAPEADFREGAKAMLREAGQLGRL